MKPKKRRHLRNRGILFLGILVLLGTTYFSAREIFHRVYVLSLTQEMLNEIVSIRIESIGGIRANLNGEVILKDTEAFTYRNGERRLFYRAKSVTLFLNGFPGSTDRLRLLGVELEEPEIHLRRDREGTWNVSWALKPPPSKPSREREESEPSEPAGPPEEPKDTFPPEGIRIRKGTIHVEIETASGETVSWSIHEVTADLKKEGAILSLHPMEGTFYGGRFRARKAEFVPGASLQANIQISVTGARVEELSAPLELDPPATGTLDAVISLTTSQNRTESRPIAAGQIEIRDADLWELPVFFQVLSVLALNPVAERKIDTANILFTIEKDRIRIDQMDFLGFPVSLFGEGEMGVAGDDLDVVFIPRLGRKGLDDLLPIIGTPIQWLLNVAKGIFVPLVLQGSFSKPEISVKPGYNVAAPIRNLIKKKRRQ